jgi:sulfonate transport system substrate-binding protein
MFGYQRLSPAGECIVVKSGSPITSVTDLAGRSVAVNRGGTGEYILVRALEQARMPLDSVRRIYLTPPDAQAAFVSGAVDGWAIWDPFLSIVLASGDAKVLADGAQCGSENAVAYLASRSFLAEHRTVVQSALAVLEAENEWARAHAGEAGAIWAKELSLPESLGQRLGENNTPPLGSVGAVAAAQIEHIADWYVANRIIPSRPDIAPFLADLGPAKS